MKKEDKKEIPKVAVVTRNEKGYLQKGSVLNPHGRPRSVLSYGGRANRERREYLLSKLLEEVDNNWDMLIGKIMEQCNEGNLKAIVSLLEFTIAKPKEREESNQIIDAGASKEEIKKEMVETLMYLRSLGERHDKISGKTKEVKDGK